MNKAILFFMAIKAINNIPQNYDTQPFEMKAFYREAGKMDSNYLSFAEASLNPN